MQDLFCMRSFFYISKNIKFFFLTLIISNIKRSPILPLRSISLGPVGQSEEIINFFKTWASSNTFGNPSYFDVKINKSDFLIYGYGFF